VEAVQRAEKEMAGPVRRLYHLAVPPAAFTSVVGVLGATGLATDARVIVEKPFGTDLASARALNEAVHEVFDESQVFRIDHFLGKEPVDNILAFYYKDSFAASHTSRPACPGGWRAGRFASGRSAGPGGPRHCRG